MKWRPKQPHDMNEQECLQKAIAFIETLGIRVEYKTLSDACFLPGLSIENGAIIIDREKLKYPGDILHEAGHIAVVSAEDRETLNAATIAQRENNAAEEMMAIAWSFAACTYLSINPYFVFHEEGYHGGGKNIADSFIEGRYFGLPMLQLYGMSAESQRAAAIGIKKYPAMEKWLRD